MAYHISINTAFIRISFHFLIFQFILQITNRKLFVTRARHSTSFDKWIVENELFEWKRSAGKQLPLFGKTTNS